MILKSMFASLCFVILMTSCQGQSALEDLSFLSGTWKIENKETFEVWNLEDDQFIGHSYKMNNGNKIITETLQIAIIDTNVVYKATVPNQNSGETIPFVLNPLVTDKLSFENLHHDFPKKIQYQQVTDSKILVQVLGEDDKGFSYHIIKQ
ncbi:DUF6265 family protein [Dokdonia sp.]|uniref:DUF6265 family protein n=1 Tax=Dokdonia sp. TaxID=2024995 RepID=UPI0032660581